MAGRSHRSLKVMAFNVNGIVRQRFKLSKKLQELHIDVSLLSQTYWKPHERDFILNYHINFFCIVGGGVQLDPLGTAAINRPIVPAPGDYDDGEIGGMIGRGDRSTRRKPASVPLYPAQTPHAARTRTRAAAVGSQRLTAWATARPNYRISRTDRSPGRKGGTSISVRRGIPYNRVDLPPLVSVEATRACLPIGNSELLLAAVYKSPGRAWIHAYIIEF
jgi:hypothetical protein